METENAALNTDRQTAIYRQGQFARINKNITEYRPKMKICGSGGISTNYIDITADELAAIEKLLTEAALPSKVNILSTAEAMQNCVKVKRINADGADWYNIYQERIETALLDVLSHGAGIDADWGFDYTDKGIFCYNSYHRMNEGGMYVEWIDFQVKIYIGHRTIDGKIDFRLSGRFGKHHDIKEYLYVLIGQGLDTL